MRYIIFIFFILCTLSAKSQQGEFKWYTIRHDTTVLYQGENNQCEKHDWVSKFNLSERSFHIGDACVYQICRKCLRLEKVKEEKVFMEKEDSYNALPKKYIQ
jgi:hypothetical protein